MDPMGLHIIKLTVYESSPDSLVDWLGSTLWGRRDFRFLDIRENPPIVAGLETLVTCFFFGLEHVKTNDFTGFRPVPVNDFNQ
jgi:hypothetical protein